MRTRSLTRRKRSNVTYRGVDRWSEVDSEVDRRFEALEARLAELITGVDGTGALWMALMRLSQRVEELSARLPKPRRRSSRKRSRR